jgi:hypothetical protein
VQKKIHLKLIDLPAYKKEQISLLRFVLFYMPNMAKGEQASEPPAWRITRSAHRFYRPYCGKKLLTDSDIF